MITYKKHAASVALVMVFAASLLVSVPTTSAVFRQSITDLGSPSFVNAGEAFPVDIRVRYDFTGEGDVRIWVRVRDPSTGGDVAIPSESAKTVHGAGEGTWNLRLTARNTPGPWGLEAYAFHWDANGQEVVDSTKGFTVQIRQPAVSFDFALRFDPSIVALRQGQYALADVKVAVVSGQPQEVTLTYTIPPVPGISATLSRTKGIPLFTSTLRIETTTQTPPGTYTVNVAGVAGTVTRVASVTVRVESAQLPPAGFDFSVTVNPNTASLRPSESASATVSVVLVNGPAQEVSFMYTIPQVVGVGATLSPTKGMPPFTAALRITTTTQTPAGTYTINIAAVGGGVEKRISVTLTVAEQPPPPPPGSVSTDWSVGDPWFIPSAPQPGDRVIFYAHVSALSSDAAFPQQISVEVQIDGRLVGRGSILVPRSGVAVTVAAGTPWTAAAGSHAVAFIADPQSVYSDPNRINNRGELSFSVAATPPPQPAGFDFSMTVTPESQSLKPEGSIAYIVYVDLQGGVSEPVSLTVSGLPPDASYAYDPPTGNPAYQSELTVYVPKYTAAGAPMPAGTYALTVTAQGGGLVRTATATLIVEAASATTTQLPPTATQAGETGGPSDRNSLLLLVVAVLGIAVVAYYLGKKRKTSTQPKQN